MKISKVTSQPPLHDREFSDRLKEIAVQKGLRIPQTEEEVRIFEEEFDADIREAKARPAPNLKTLLAQARSLSSSSEAASVPIEAPSLFSELALAARNGLNISDEVSLRMDAAIEKLSQKKSDERSD
jgi:hypothetical protein